MADEQGKVTTSAFATDGDTSLPDFANSIPEAYRDKPYMKDIDSSEKLYQQFDNAQALIGKKTVGVPTAESAPEEWDKFYSQMGRPESADKYEYDKVEGMPENFKNEESDKKLSELFHKNGLTASQAKALRLDYDTMTKETFEKLQADQVEKTKALDTEFEGMLDKHFGDQKIAATERANKLLQDNTPDEFKDLVNNLDNKNLMLLTTVLEGVHKKYVGEDSIDKGEKVPTQTPEIMRANAKTIMASQEFKDPMNPQNELTKKKVAEIYKQIALSEKR